MTTLTAETTDRLRTEVETVQGEVNRALTRWEDAHHGWFAASEMFTRLTNAVHDLGAVVHTLLIELGGES